MSWGQCSRFAVRVTGGFALGRSVEPTLTTAGREECLELADELRVPDFIVPVLRRSP